MSFALAVEATPEVRGALRPGLAALATAHRNRVRYRASRDLRGSIDIDRATAARYPNAPRWDYVVGWKPHGASADVVSWIEVHPATPHGATEVLTKLRWLRRWLRMASPALERLPREFVWIASGKVSPNLTNSLGPKLAQQGLTFAGRVHTLQNSPVQP